MDQDDNGGGTPPAVETEALALGWVPKERFRGDEARWVDAATFVERGHSIMPILKANNAELLRKFSQSQQEQIQLKEALRAQTENLKNLTEFQSAEVKRQVDRQLATLKAQKREAIKAGEHELAADIDEQMDTVKEDAAKAPKLVTPAPTPAGPQPWAQDFAAENEWLGKDKRKTGLFMGIADEIFAKEGLRDRALLDRAKEELDAYLAPAQQPNRGESGRGGSGGTGGGSSSKKGFDSLPAEAKAQCNKDERTFVGTGKAFKTQAEWRSYYADTYLADESL